MRKNELIAIVAGKTGVSKGTVKEVLNSTLAVIQMRLANGEKVELLGFGSFDIKNRQGRQGLIPGTQKKVEIPATKYVSFKNGKILKQEINK